MTDNKRYEQRIGMDFNNNYDSNNIIMIVIVVIIQIIIMKIIITVGSFIALKPVRLDPPGDIKYYIHDLIDFLKVV